MNKVIIFGNTLYNTLGLIRSIGKKGLPVILMSAPGYIMAIILTVVVCVMLTILVRKLLPRFANLVYGGR